MVETATYFHACHIATSNSVKQHKLRKRIAWLSRQEVKEKTLISLYISPNLSIDQTSIILKQEIHSEAKLETKRAEYEEALKKLVQYLKQKIALPETGLALFAGVIFNNELESDQLTLEEIIPPEPVAIYRLSVDNHFDLSPLREMLRDQKIVGIIVLDAKTASFGLSSNESFQFLETITSGVPGKTSKGGQSQRRYERERNMELTNFYHRVGEHATKLFMENKVNVLVVGGPGQTKNDFFKGDFLHYEIMNSLVNIADTQRADREGLKDAYSRSIENIRNMCGPEERRIIQRLMSALSKDGLATYGLDPVLNALKKGEVEVVLVTDDSGLIEAVASCKRCGLVKSQIITETQQALKELVSIPCEKCGSNEYSIIKKDIVDTLEDLASETNARVEVISTASKEKNELAALGGVAALLRYKPELQRN